MSVEHLIIAAVGVGYATVGVLQFLKGELATGIIWSGYAFSQIGLYMITKG